MKKGSMKERKDKNMKGTMKITFKRIMSVILTLAMIVTSLSYSPREVKAAQSDAAAYDWSGVAYAGDAGTGNANKYKFVRISESGNLDVIQHPGFANEAGMYMTFADSDFGNIELNGTVLDNTKYVIQGAGIIVYVSNYTNKYNDLVIKNSQGNVKGEFYVFYVDGVDGSGGETSSSETTSSDTSPAETISAPVGIVVDLNGQGTYTVSFTNVDGATSYKLYVDGNFVQTITNGGTIEPASIGAAGTSHEIQLTAVKGEVESPKSAAVTVHLSTVTDLDIKTCWERRHCTVSWGTVAGASSYDVYVDGKYVDTVDTNKIVIDAYKFANNTDSKGVKTTVGTHTIFVKVNGNQSPTLTEENADYYDTCKIYVNYMYGSITNFWNTFFPTINSEWNFTVCTSNEDQSVSKISTPAEVNVVYNNNGTADISIVNVGRHTSYTNEMRTAYLNGTSEETGDQAWTIKTAIYDNPTGVTLGDPVTVSFSITGPAYLIGQKIQIKCVDEEVNENADGSYAGYKTVDKVNGYEEAKYAFVAATDSNGNKYAVLNYTNAITATQKTDYDLLFGLGLLDPDVLNDGNPVELEFSDVLHDTTLRNYITDLTTSSQHNNEIGATWTVTNTDSSGDGTYSYKVYIDGEYKETVNTLASSTFTNIDAGKHSVTVESVFTNTSTGNSVVTGSVTKDVEVEGASYADIIITKIDIEPKVYEVGDTVKVTATVKNNGSADLDLTEGGLGEQITKGSGFLYSNMYTNLFCKVDGVQTPGNSGWGGLAYATEDTVFASGETQTISYNYTIPAGALTNNYSIGFRADCDNKYNALNPNDPANIEVDTTNNDLFVPLRPAVFGETVTFSQDAGTVTATWPADAEAVKYSITYTSGGESVTVESNTNSYIFPADAKPDPKVKVYVFTIDSSDVEEGYASGMPSPDLIISSITISPSKASYEVGDSVTVRITMQNIGTTEARPNAGNLMFGCKSGTTSDYANMTNLGDGYSICNAGVIPVNGTYYADFNYTFVEGDVGTYYFAGRADADGTVTENNESNNDANTSVTVTSATVVPKPDLVITSITAPKNAYHPGDIIPITMVMTNDSEVDTETVGGNIVEKLIANGALTGAYSDIGIHSLAAGASITFTFNYQVPNDYTQTTIVFKGLADADGVIDEVASGEEPANSEAGGNNTSAPLTIRILESTTLTLTNTSGTVTGTWHAANEATGYKVEYTSNGVVYTEVVDTTSLTPNAIYNSVSELYTFTFSRPLDNNSDVKVYATYDDPITGSSVYYDYTEAVAKADLVISDIKFVDGNGDVLSSAFAADTYEDVKFIVTIENIGTAQVANTESESNEDKYAHAIHTAVRSGSNSGTVLAGVQYNGGLLPGANATVDTGVFEFTTAGVKTLYINVDDAAWNSGGEPVGYITESNEGNNSQQANVTVTFERHPMDWTPFYTSSSITVGEDVYTGGAGDDLTIDNYSTLGQVQTVGNVSGYADGTKVSNIANGTDWRPIEFKVIDTNIDNIDLVDVVTKWKSYNNAYTSIEFDANTPEQRVINSTTSTFYFTQVTEDTIDSYDHSDDSGVGFVESTSANSAFHVWDGNGFQFHTVSFAPGKYYLAKIENEENGKYVVVAFRVPGDIGDWVKAKSNNSSADEVPYAYHRSDYIVENGSLYYDASDLNLAVVTIYNSNHIEITLDSGHSYNADAQYRRATLQYGHLDNEGNFVAGVGAAELEELGSDPGEVEVTAALGLRETSLQIGFPDLMRQLPIHSPNGGAVDSEYYLLKVYYDTEHYPTNFISIPLKLETTIPEIVGVQNLRATARGEDLILNWDILPAQKVAGDEYTYDVYVKENDVYVKQNTTPLTAGTFTYTGFTPIDGNTYDIKVVANWCQQTAETLLTYTVNGNPETMPGKEPSNNEDKWVLISGENTLPIKDGNGTTEAQIYYYTDDDLNSVVGYNGYYISLNGNADYFKSLTSQIFVQNDGEDGRQFKQKTVYDNYYDGQILINAANMMGTYTETEVSPYLAADNTYYYTVRVTGDGGNTYKDFYFKAVIGGSEVATNGEWMEIYGQSTLPIKAVPADPVYTEAKIYFYDYKSLTNTYAMTGYNDYFISMLGSNTYYVGENTKLYISDASETEIKNGAGASTTFTEVAAGQNYTEKTIYDKLYDGEIQFRASDVFTAKWTTTYYLLKVVDTKGTDDTADDAATYVPVKVEVASGEVEVQGFQMNTDTSEGAVSEFNPSFRVVSKQSNIIAIENELHSVQARGTIFAENDAVKDNYANMVLDSSNENVNHLQATEDKGIISGFTTKDREDLTSKFYAVTFKQTKYYYESLERMMAFRAYAVLDNGTVVYGRKVYATSIYRIAQNLYENKMMGTKASHEFLYDNVLCPVSLKNNRSNIIKTMYTAIGVTSTDHPSYPYLTALFRDMFNFAVCNKGTVYSAYEGNNYSARGSFRMSDSANETALLGYLNEATSTDYDTVLEWIQNHATSNGIYKTVAYDWGNEYYDQFDYE